MNYIKAHKKMWHILIYYFVKDNSLYHYIFDEFKELIYDFERHGHYNKEDIDEFLHLI